MNAKIKTYNLNRQLVWLLLVGLIFAAGLYIYLVNAIILNVVEKKTALSTITKLEADIATIDAVYIELAGQITPELATVLGFIDPTLNSTYLAATPLPYGGQVSLAN